jgi:hypothetical protein
VSDGSRCQGDGERDITVAELYRRLDRFANQEDGVTDEERWNLPDILRVETAT